MTTERALLQWTRVSTVAGFAAAVWMIWRWVIPAHNLRGLWWPLSIGGAVFHAISVVMLCLTPAVVVSEVRRIRRDAPRN